MPTTPTRFLLAALVPGIVAASPWVLALLQYTSVTLGLEKYPAIAYALLFGLIAVVGSVIEGLGSVIEERWDNERESEYAVSENWYAYLSYAEPKEPVGFRYLSQLATALYFELSMLLAIPIFLVGTGLLTALRFPQLACVIVVVSLVGAIVSILYFRWQARSTHEVLCKSRRKLNELLAS